MSSSSARLSKVSGFEQYGQASGQRWVSSASRPSGAGSCRSAHATSIRFAREFGEHVVHVAFDLRAIGGVERGQLIDDLADGPAAVAAAENFAGRSFGLDHPFRAEQHPRVARRVEMQADAGCQARALRQLRRTGLRHRRQPARTRRAGSARARRRNNAAHPACTTARRT